MKTYLAKANEGSAGSGDKAREDGKEAKTGAPVDIARDRFKVTRDPAAPSGAIVVPGLDNSDEKHPAANTGSRFFSSFFEGDWVVINARFQIVKKGPFKNEQEASDEAAKLNGNPEAATLDFE